MQLFDYQNPSGVPDTSGPSQGGWGAILKKEQDDKERARQADEENKLSMAQQKEPSGLGLGGGLDPSQYLPGILEKLRNAPEYQDQKKGLQDFENQSRESILPGGNTAQAIYAAADQLSGGNLSKTAPRGPTFEDQQKIKQYVQDQKGALAKELFSNATHLANTKGQNVALASERLNDARIGRFMRGVDSDPVLKKAPEIKQAVNTARSLLDKNDAVSASNFRFSLLHALGVGRLTDYELQGEQGSKGLWDKLDQRANTLIGEGLTDKNRGQYVELLNTLDKRHNDMVKARMDYQTKRGTRVYGVSPEKVKYAMDPQMTELSPSQTPPPSSAGPQVGQIVDGHKFKGGNPGDPTSWEKI